MEFVHKSVLLEETVGNLNVKPDGIYVDGTLGGGGHAHYVCSQLNENGRFFGIDQDSAAIQAAGERLAEFGEKVTIIRSNRKTLSIELKPNEIIARAPARMKEKEIYKFIESKKSWIDKHLTKLNERQKKLLLKIKEDEDKK